MSQIEDAIEVTLSAERVQQWLNGKDTDVQDALEGALDQAQGYIKSGEVNHQLVMVMVK